MTRKEAWETLHPLWGHKGGPVTWSDLALVADYIRMLEESLAGQARRAEGLEELYEGAMDRIRELEASIAVANTVIEVLDPQSATNRGARKLALDRRARLNRAGEA